MRNLVDLWQNCFAPQSKEIGRAERAAEIVDLTGGNEEDEGKKVRDNMKVEEPAGTESSSVKINVSEDESNGNYISFNMDRSTPYSVLEVCRLVLEHLTNHSTLSSHLPSTKLVQLIQILENAGMIKQGD